MDHVWGGRERHVKAMDWDLSNHVREMCLERWVGLGGKTKSPLFSDIHLKALVAIQGEKSVGDIFGINREAKAEENDLSISTWALTKWNHCELGREQNH